MSEQLKSSLRKKIQSDVNLDIVFRLEMTNWIENQSISTLSMLNKMPYKQMTLQLKDELRKKESERRFSKTATRDDTFQVRNWSMSNSERPNLTYSIPNTSSYGQNSLPSHMQTGYNSSIKDSAYQSPGNRTDSRWYDPLAVPEEPLR